MNYIYRVSVFGQTGATAKNNFWMIKPLQPRRNYVYSHDGRCAKVLVMELGRINNGLSYDYTASIRLSPHFFRFDSLRYHCSY